ncbi:lipid A biosynthesis lauroyl acyltransferase [Mergibacter septicus]|uniref:Kdo(2)-lipid IV(A) acyltransferase n=1 Tax=Mergibacter septicus TaxID=221402 RepID=UPI001C78A34B|nr:Kdo(2)-lipid IV(A) acyltransferase [Mergibacter septicus]QDJ12989.1 lipid A biosynthesis lauroyl acyltransferase [Mergibacter septicus]
MKKKTTIKPNFKLTFLAPKYWLLWLAVGLFRLILCLPYPCLVKLGKGLGWVFARLKVGKKRINIARRNLELCFPDLSEQEKEKLLAKNIEAVGLAIIETGMAWFWSDKRIKKWSKVEGLEHLSHAADQGVLFIGIHFLTLELGARIVGLSTPGIGIYRPNNNPVFDWIQTRGRLRSNKGMIDRRNLRAMLSALRQGEIIWYAPDHDYGQQNSVFVPFFAVAETATTTGSHLLLKACPKTKVVPFAPLRNPDYSGYTVYISPEVDFSDCENQQQTAQRMNQAIETEILRDPSQYMWLHRRFKSRPEGQADYYNN